MQPGRRVIESTIAKIEPKNKGAKLRDRVITPIITEKPAHRRHDNSSRTRSIVGVN